MARCTSICVNALFFHFNLGIMKIVLAFDSFKGSATSVEVAEAAKRAVKRLDSEINVVTVPVADGGEGTVSAIVSMMGDAAQVIDCTVRAPMPTQGYTTASYAILDGKTAIMELAAASGLTLVPRELRNVMLATTFGTGEMILDAIERGCRDITLGIGGSATCDAAMGLLSALGFRFFGKNGDLLLPMGMNLALIDAVDDTNVPHAVLRTHFMIISDVNNPLYGPNGSAYVFGPQKGATHDQVISLDKGLRNFARIMPEGVAETPGAGAAGGVGGGMSAFLNAKILPGTDAVLNLLHFEDTIADADLIITGEGRIDAQTAMGKAPGGVLRAGMKRGIPVIALCGGVADIDVGATQFEGIYSINSAPVNLDDAMRNDVTLANVEETTRYVVGKWLEERNASQ
jgi:glycerate kinase